MNPEQLASKISAVNNEPPELRQLRQQSATALPETLTDHLNQILEPQDTARLDVSPEIWDNLKNHLEQHSITLTPLTTAVKHNPAILAHIQPRTPVQQFATAFFTNGTYIHVPAGVNAQKVLQPVFREFAKPQIDLTLIHLEKNATATVVEGCSAPRSSSFRAGHTHIHLEKGSKLQYSNLQNWKHTTLLDSTSKTGPGDLEASQFISTEKGIVETRPQSTTIINRQGIKGNNLRIHIDQNTTIHGSFNKTPLQPKNLKHLPPEYRTELQHIHELGD